MSQLVKTKAIVLDHVLYRENSAIVRTYTRELGRQDYIVNGVRGSRKSRKTALLQPLNCLSMEVYYSPNKDLHRIREFSIQRPMVTIPYRQSTRAQAFFLTELLSKLLVTQDQSHELFDFLENAIELMDSGVEGGENLHLFVMYRLTGFMGFQPENNQTGARLWFDLKNGYFSSSEPSHPLFLNPEQSELFARLFEVDVYSLKNIARNVHEREIILESLLNFFRTHTNVPRNLKSLDVLHAMLHF